MGLTNLVQIALSSAKSLASEVGDQGTTNRNRSSTFVEQLGTQFNLRYADDTNVRTLTRGNPKNRKEFGLNELLYDVSVCRVSEIASSKQSKQLTVINQTLWSVESELRKDSREAIFDFNKLIMSSAQNKLFVGPIVDDIESYIAVLARAAQFCNGRLHLALIPHPSQWDSVPMVPQLWKWNGSDWVSEAQ